MFFTFSCWFIIALQEITKEKRQGVLMYNSSEQRWISSILKERDKEELGGEQGEGGSQLDEKRSRLHSVIFPNTAGHRLPSKQGLRCPLSAGDESLRWHYDSSYCVPVLRWVLYNGLAKPLQPLAPRGCQRAPSACIGRADVTFSWPLPCWSLLWAGRGDNDMAPSPSQRGALCAQCHTWPLTFTSQYLSLSFITASPWWISLLSCGHSPSSPCWSWESILIGQLPQCCLCVRVGFCALQCCDAGYRRCVEF